MTRIGEQSGGQVAPAELQQRAGSLFAHAEFSDDVEWRRGVCANTLLRGSQEPRDAWRVELEHGDQVPFSVSQQEQGR